MAVTIKVAVRCRPYTIDDGLGLLLDQAAEEDGQITLLNSTYTNTHFAFSWAWWSAYGWERHFNGPDKDKQIADGMKKINQDDCYAACGHKIKDDLMKGNAVVLFAYGLSGSGKTFTVFGPDAADVPEAWFKHAEPHPMWGLFPRLAYELFQSRQDGWKITMKYFQNVVDTVRDLMSPVAQEQSYKSGMKKDPDGFMDITWCQSQVLTDWNDLRRKFLSANAKKAIAPTQFNHQSTRGHCIMTLEVEMPHPEQEGMKQRGRVYVCDLAGTEPAGDIFFARYQKVSFDDGTVEHKLIGPHQDQKKTKELQDQGKKINLSLSEMAQFFMKMAEAIKKKKLKPGKSIPGCNSYFLCKYLKDTMLQARTYLFCAVRPEIKYHQYTYATLGFAKNASVVKLQPKKAQVNMSARERKLMAELEQMKVLVEELKKAGGGEGGDDSEEVAALKATLAQKQKEMAMGLTDDDGPDPQELMLQQQKEEYASRGISLTHYDHDTEFPHLVNIDEDGFRSRRFMYIFCNDSMSFGSHGDFKPLSLSLVDDHCSVVKESVVLSGGETANGAFLVGGKGEVYHNGLAVEDGRKLQMAHNDRLVVANELMMFVDPAVPADGGDEPMSAWDCIQEFQAGKKAAAAGSGTSDAQQQALLEQMRKFEEDKERFEKEKAARGENAGEEDQKGEDYEKAMQAVDQEILELLPKIKEARDIVNLFDRGHLNFEVSLRKATDSSVPKVSVLVNNLETKENIYIDTFEFLRGFGGIQDELKRMKMAIDNGRDYEVHVTHDPVKLFFDNTFLLGTVTCFLEYTTYNLDTEEDGIKCDIKRAVLPYDNCGMVEIKWTPLSDPDAEVGMCDIAEVEDPSDLIGKPWTYKVEIKGVIGLPLTTDMAYCQYDFFGTLFTTETVEQETSNPTFDYSFVHHVPCVTEEFLEYLNSASWTVELFVSPYVDNSQLGEPLGTRNQRVVDLFAGKQVARRTGGVGSIPRSASVADVEELDRLRAEKTAWEKEREELLGRIRDLEGQLGQGSITARKLGEAKATDAELNTV